jgi:uncharacterized SAM-binding protein YcdF (DUF218 family)
MKRKFIVLAVVLLAILGLYISHPLILDQMAKFLVVQDKLEKADVILVLAGDGNGERVREGVQLYRQDYAKYMLMSGGPLAWKLTSAQWMRKQAVESGIPEKYILLQEKSRSTIDDAEFSLPIVKEHHFRSVILVTSPYHTRRAARVFRKIFSKEGIAVIVHPVENSEFNPDRWWTRHEDVGVVVWEYVAFVLYFLKGY